MPPGTWEAAAAMRRAGTTKPAIAAELGVHPKTLQVWFRQDGVAAVPQGHAPELRGRAAQMRREGVGRAEIARTLEVGASTVARWFREDGVPGDRVGRAAAAAGVRRTVAERWAHQDAEQAARAAAVGPLTDREQLLVAAALYWAEGSKAEPWRRASG